MTGVQTCALPILNIWTGDGYKDIPADRMGPRVRYKEAIDEILSEPYDPKMVKPCVESKVFGIGVEDYQDGRLIYRSLYKYEVTDNVTDEYGNARVVGCHQKTGTISDTLRKRLLDNGISHKELAEFNPKEEK